MRAKDGKMLSYLLNARKEQLDTSLATVSEITWAFADTTGLETQILDGVYMEGCALLNPNLAGIVTTCVT